eukprot:403347584
MVDRKYTYSNSLRIEKIALGDIKQEKDLHSRYRKEKHIGNGNYGDVYLVSKRQYFAMKQYKEIPTEADLVELRLMQSIKSKYLCLLEDSFFSDQNEFMIVQQYAKHGDLLCYCRDTLNWEIQENLAKEWLAQLTFGLKELHTRSVIHRDIKPENILVFEKDEVKLSDFGQAKIVENTLKTKQTITGTLQYMSVEMKMCQPYDDSTDIYSLGMTFIFILTQKIPTLEEIMDPKWLPSIKNFSKDFILLLRQMISYRKVQRPNVFEILNIECIKATKAFTNHQSHKVQEQNEISLQSTNPKYDCNFCQAARHNESQLKSLLPEPNKKSQTFKEIVKTKIIQQEGVKLDKKLDAKNIAKNFVDNIQQQLENQQIKIDPELQIKIKQKSNNRQLNNDVKKWQNVEIMLEREFNLNKHLDNTFDFKDSLNLSSVDDDDDDDESVRGQEELMNSFQNKLISDWNNKTFELLFQGSDYDFKANKFHEKCDGISPTLIFILSDSGNVFGGYTRKAWQSNYELKQDKCAFLFIKQNYLYTQEIK